MINYFSLLIPILLIYMARYYILKHDYEQLEETWNYTLNRQKEIMNTVRKYEIDLINLGSKMSENEEENEKEQN